MKVLALGTLRSKVVDDLEIAVPLEYQVRLQQIALGEAGRTPLDALLTGLLGGPVSVHYEVSLLPLSLHFRGDVTHRIFATAALPETEAAAPAAVLDCILRQAGVPPTRARDVLVVGDGRGAGRRPNPGAANHETLKALARSLRADLLGGPQGAVKPADLARQVFGEDYAQLLLRAFQILLVTHHPRLAGDAVEAYRKLEERLVAGRGFDLLYEELGGILAEAPSFIKFGTRLLRLRSDLSRWQQADAQVVVASLGDEITPDDERDYPVLLGQFYVDFVRYLQDVRGIELTKALLPRLEKLTEPGADAAAQPGLIFLAEHRLGRGHYLRGAFPEALKCYQSALDALDRMSRSDGAESARGLLRLTRAEILNSVGKVFTDLLYPRAAFGFLAEAARLRLVLDAGCAQAATYGSLAEVLARLGRYAEAEALFLKDLNACEDKDKLRVRNYLAVLKALSRSPAGTKEAAPEFEAIYEQYMGVRDYAQASYAAAGRAMCALRLGEYETVEALWQTWVAQGGTQGESLPRGFITLLQGAALGRQGNWAAAAGLVDQATEILRADSYLMEAAAAQLELAALACQRVGGEGESGAEDSAAEAGVLRAIQLIEEFRDIRQKALASFDYQITEVAPAAARLTEIQDMPLPPNDAVLNNIRGGAGKLRAGVKGGDLQLIRDVQKKCHFWFHVLGRSANEPVGRAQTREVPA